MFAQFRMRQNKDHLDEHPNLIQEDCIWSMHIFLDYDLNFFDCLILYLFILLG